MSSYTTLVEDNAVIAKCTYLLDTYKNPWSNKNLQSVLVGNSKLTDEQGKSKTHF